MDVSVVLNIQLNEVLFLGFSELLLLLLEANFLVFIAVVYLDRKLRFEVGDLKLSKDFSELFSF